MAKKTTTIPKAPVAQILKMHGAQRVSSSAAEAFVDVLQDISEDIAKRAVMIAKHAGRKTVHDKDIKLAARE